ncbi:MAG: hypothetical protein ACUVRS_08570 [Armatimonadota bacterium]
MRIISLTPQEMHHPIGIGRILSNTPVLIPLPHFRRDHILSCKEAKELRVLVKAVSAGNLLAKSLTKSPLIGHVPYVSIQDIAEISGLSISEINHITNLARAKMQTLTDIIAWAETRL